MSSRMRSAVRAVGHHLAGVRVRLTVVATVLLAVALACAAAIMLSVLHNSLLNSADAAAAARATQIAATVRTESLQGIDSETVAPSKDLDIIQVLDAAGRVRASSPSGRGGQVVDPVAVGAHETIDGAQIEGRGDEFRTTVVGVDSPAGPLTIAVGAAEGPINDVVITVAILFCAVFPIILLVLAFASYLFVGRVLRPVEGIRAQVAEMSSKDLSARVPESGAGDEISTLARTMNAMLDRLQLAREQQLRFVGDASHELRSPLMSIYGLLDLARTTGRPLDLATIDSIMLPEVSRLQAMVDDLLLLAKADERGIPLVMGDVDLDDIVAEAAHRTDTLSPITIRARVTPIRVSGDREKLSRAVRNVVDNAVRHAHSAVTMTMATTGDGMGQIVVSDDGPGIPAAERERIFDRFVRLDADRERSAGGSGLGLAIVSEIVRAHAGTVRAGEAPGGGAAITISVPTSASAE
ncbi:ATP-binding protein [Williamsia herbipolensis]|uniref:histidine kinase n=1 Tax=Williamsia herbipolensis TaxID=1603258 RepID=A0AAU4JYX9_9NOCA|nr:ATP-binding protein [Williamsia herbipolensis]